MNNDELRAILEKRRAEYALSVKALDEQMEAMRASRALHSAHLAELEFALEALGPASQVSAQSSPAPEPCKERAPRRNIADMCLDAITSRLIETKPLPESDAVEYLAHLFDVRKDAVTKALAKLIKRKQLFVIDGHLSVTAPVPVMAADYQAQVVVPTTEDIPLVQDRRVRLA